MTKLDARRATKNSLTVILIDSGGVFFTDTVGGNL